MKVAAFLVVQAAMSSALERTGGTCKVLAQLWGFVFSVRTVLFYVTQIRALHTTVGSTFEAIHGTCEVSAYVQALVAAVRAVYADVTKACTRNARPNGALELSC